MDKGFIRPILSLVILFVVLAFLGFDIRDVINENFFLNVWEEVQKIWAWIVATVNNIF